MLIPPRPGGCASPGVVAGNRISRFEVAAANCYAAPMSRKSPSDSSRGFNDVIGVALLLLVALPLLVAQLSFDRYDLSFIHIPANKPVHNWIGPFGAQVAYASFFVFRNRRVCFPALVAVFGLGYLFNFWPHLRERRLWSGIWGLVLMLSLTGLLNMMDGLFKPLRENVDVQSAGGWVGPNPVPVQAVWF